MSCYYFSSLTENFNNKTSFTYQTSLSSRFFRTKDSTLNNLNDSILCHCASLWWRLFDIKSYIYKPTSRQACKSASLRMIFICKSENDIYKTVPFQTKVQSLALVDYSYISVKRTCIFLKLSYFKFFSGGCLLLNRCETKEKR